MNLVCGPGGKMTVKYKSFDGWAKAQFGKPGRSTSEIKYDIAALSRKLSMLESELAREDFLQTQLTAARYAWNVIK